MAICNYETVRGNEAKYVVYWTDNPVHDAENYSAAGDRWMEEHAPVCEECGRPIMDSKCTVLEDACICNECRDKLIGIVEKHFSRYMAGVVEDLMDESKEDTPVKDTDAWI